MSVGSDDAGRYEVTECVICADTYTDPRQLPCMHTFCRTCIETHCQSVHTDSQSADQLLMPACPLCRRRFSLPRVAVDTRAGGGSGSGGGVAANLPKDRFIGKMLMVQRLTSQVKLYSGPVRYNLQWKTRTKLPA